MVCFCSFLPSYSVTTVDYGGKIYTKEVGRCYRSSLFSPWVVKDLMLLEVIVSHKADQSSVYK